MSEINLTFEDIQKDTCPVCASEDALQDVHTGLEIPEDDNIQPYFYSEIFCCVCNAKWRTFSNLELWSQEYKEARDES